MSSVPQCPEKHPVLFWYLKYSPIRQSLCFTSIVSFCLKQNKKKMFYFFSKRTKEVNKMGELKVNMWRRAALHQTGFCFFLFCKSFCRGRISVLRLLSCETSSIFLSLRLTLFTFKARLKTFFLVNPIAWVVFLSCSLVLLLDGEQADHLSSLWCCL